MLEKEAYAALGVHPGIDTKRLRHAYTRLALRHHPDRKGGNEAAFSRISEAYSVLSKALKKGFAPQNNHGRFRESEQKGPGLGTIRMIKQYAESAKIIPLPRVSEPLQPGTLNAVAQYKRGEPAPFIVLNDVLKAA